MRAVRQIALWALGLPILLFGYQNCGPSHSIDGTTFTSFSGGSCEAILADAFSKSYHSFLTSKCATCHVPSGPGKGKFAQPDPSLAFAGFYSVGESKVAQYAVNPNHNPPYTGTGNQGAVDAAKATWAAAQPAYIACKGTDTGGGTTTPMPSGPRIDTKPRTINATTNYVAINFNLGTEMVDATKAMSGATFTVDVRSFTSATGETSYNFRNPRLRAGGVALSVRDIMIIINNQIYTTGTTWSSVYRKVPLNQIRTVSTGVLIAERAIAATDTLAISFGDLRTTTFNPPTYAQLIAANGIFTQNCTGCHGATNPRAGLNLTNYASLINSFQVVPFVPNDSPVFERMSDPNDPMPQSGLLGTAAQEQILWWIEDGAPQ